MVDVMVMLVSFRVIVYLIFYGVFGVWVYLFKAQFLFIYSLLFILQLFQTQAHSYKGKEPKDRT